MAKFLLLSEAKVTYGAVCHFNAMRFMQKMNKNRKIKNIFHATSWLREYFESNYLQYALTKDAQEIMSDEFDFHLKSQHTFALEISKDTCRVALLQDFGPFYQFPYLSLYMQNYIRIKSLDLDKAGYCMGAFMLRQTDIDDVIQSRLSQDWQIYRDDMLTIE